MLYLLCEAKTEGVEGIAGNTDTYYTGTASTNHGQVFNPLKIIISSQFRLILLNAQEP